MRSVVTLKVILQQESCPLRVLLEYDERTFNLNL